MTDISRMVFLSKVHFIRTSLPTEQVCNTETALFQVIHRVEMSLNHKEFALGAFLDVEVAFDNTSFKAITRAASECGLEDT